MSDITITTIDVEPRGCGLRQQGGFYLIGDPPTETTRFFPKSLQCGCGLDVMRPSRSVQGFFPARIWPSLTIDGPANPLFKFEKDQKAWAVTIDVRNYPTPGAYFEEALRMGISRRLNNGMPKGFVLGESFAFIIHSKAIRVGIESPDAKGEDVVDGYKPGFVACFKPTAIQYVVHGGESEAYLRSLVEKGITLVNVPGARPPK